MLHQRAVVVEVAPRDVDLGLGGLRLLLGLLHARVVFGGVDAGDDLSGLDGIAFAHAQTLQFARHPSLDHRGVHRLDRPREGNAGDQFAGCHLHHIGSAQLHYRLGVLRCQFGDRLLLQFARRQGTPDAAGEQGQDQGEQRHFQPRFHDARFFCDTGGEIGRMFRPLRMVSTCRAM